MYRKKYILVIMIFNICFAQNWLQNQRLERQFKEAISSYNEGRYATSETILNDIISSGYDSYNEEALLLLLKSQIALNKSTEAKQTAKNFFSSYPRSKVLNYTMESLGDLYVNNANYESAYRMYTRAKSLSDDYTYRAIIDSKLLKLIKIKLPETLFDELLVMETDLASSNIHLLAIAYSQIMDGMPDDAALTLVKIDPSVLSDEFSQLFELLLRESYRPSSPVLMVGLALPLTGSNSELGNAFLDGFRKGQNSNYNNQRLSILARDTRSDDFEAIKIINELEKIDQLIASISPASETTSLSLLSSISDSDLPVLLTSKQKGDLTTINNKAFLLGSNYSLEGKIAAQYIVKHLGLDSIAVVAPADKNTEIQIDAFISEVDRLGGNVVATEWYKGEPKNLSRQFRFLRQVAFSLDTKEKIFDEALGMEIDSLDALFDVSADDFFDLPQSTAKKMTSSDSSKVLLNTIQAIYLPINYEDLEYIGPQIPMYNFDTKIVGNASWQQLEILTKENIGPHLKGMSIISGLFNSISDSINIYHNNLVEYQMGYYSSKLLTNIEMNEMSRAAFNKSLREIGMYNDEGFNYYPSITNNNINSAFQLINFNGNDLIKSGVLTVDSLITVSLQNP
ncbi:MAG: penicillin-binding protein activator [Candidatus Neomarinimicrobiota bacterium]|nr:penicillin-binding protein activator [Candidatus Neomarinimicrobiota bacterium]